MKARDQRLSEQMTELVPSVWLSVCLSFYLSLFRSLSLPVCPTVFVCLSFSFSLSRSLTLLLSFFSLFATVPVFLYSVCTCMCQSICMYVCLSMCACVFCLSELLPVCLNYCLSVCLSISHVHLCVCLLPSSSWACPPRLLSMRGWSIPWEQPRAFHSSLPLIRSAPSLLMRQMEVIRERIQVFGDLRRFPSPYVFCLCFTIDTRETILTRHLSLRISILISKYLSISFSV